MKAQIEWEQECLDRGSEKYYAAQDKLREMGRVESSDVVSSLLQERLQEVATRLETLSNKTVGIGAKSNKYLKQLAVEDDFLKVAYVGTQHAFQVLTIPEKNTVLKICLQIATRLEAELKCTLFELSVPKYYHTVQRSLKDQNVTDYTHKHKVFMKKFAEFELSWNEWGHEYKIQVGQKVLCCILETFDDVFFINKEWRGGKSTAKLDTTVAFDDWAAELEKERGFMFPVLLPLKAPPIPWEKGQPYGGYYTPKLAAALPLIKTKGKLHKEFVQSVEPEAHKRAINKMQATQWCVNKKVLEVQREVFARGLEIGMPSSKPTELPPFPEHLREIEKDALTPENKEEIGCWKVLTKRAHAKEKQRKGKILTLMQTRKLAEELQEWEHFYYAYNCDFRGRIYCATTGLSPQGADGAKGILKFAHGVRVGTQGLKWLAIQGANTYGYDKHPYEDRVAWIKQHKENIKRVVDSPIATRDWWAEADKPYQFLAFCFEWAESNYGEDKEFISHLPIGLDGSCNGLQHYSAMLADEVGAYATNLTNTETPQDIYNEVALVAIAKLEAMDDPRATKWLSVGITRKCAKRPVMTLPYGATQQSVREALLEYAQENWAKFNLEEEHQWAMVTFLSPILWKSIGEVVIAAREAMAWLKRNSGKEFVQWYTPLNFPVHQFYKQTKKRRIVTALAGELRLNYHDIDEVAEASVTKQRSGIAPNFIHSIDSTHMVVTILMTKFTSYAMIHDDFGTHAGNTEELFVAIRKAFLWLYRKKSPLESWAEQTGVTEALPSRGSYDINSIREAQFFFG